MTILEILERKGPLTDLELFDALKESYQDIGFGDVNQTLMKLELSGKIYVSTLARGKRRVELVKRRK
jgi:Fe2+ or Zn2+ uptake regulation protein